MWVIITGPKICEHGNLRLSNNSLSPQIGHLEICGNNNWGSICDMNWDNEDAVVACRQLGYDGWFFKKQKQKKHYNLSF